MYRKMGILILMAIILTLLVPLSQDWLQSEQAFTHDNLIFINASTQGQ